GNGPSGASDLCLECTDLSGASALQAPASFLADWNALGCCGTFCYDTELINDGNPGASVAIFPSFTIKNSAGKGFRFVAVPGITGPGGANPGWHNICAPIGPLTSGGVPPSNAQGSWVPLAGTANSDWPNVVCSVTDAIFPVDYSANPSEVTRYDNFCLSKCFT